MISLPTLRSGIYNILKDKTTLPIIWDRQSGPEPAKPYITLRIGNVKQIHHEERGEIENDSSQDIKSVYSLTLQIRCVGPDAVQYSQHLDFIFNLESVIYAFEALGLEFYDKDEVRDSPQLLSTKWEDRAIQNVYFYLVDVEEDSPGWVEHFELTATINDINGDLLIQRTEMIDVIAP